jgi:hypothetical protein
MTDHFDIAVTTLLYRDDGELFADLGTMRWFGVDQEVREWLTGSCKTTAFWLMNVPEVIDGESYTLKYRTLVGAAGTWRDAAAIRAQAWAGIRACRDAQQGGDGVASAAAVGAEQTDKGMTWQSV